MQAPKAQGRDFVGIYICALPVAIFRSGHTGGCRTSMCGRRRHVTHLQSGSGPFPETQTAKNWPARALWKARQLIPVLTIQAVGSAIARILLYPKFCSSPLPVDIKTQQRAMSVSRVKVPTINVMITMRKSNDLEMDILVAISFRLVQVSRAS